MCHQQIIIALENLTGKSSQVSPLFTELAFNEENLNIGHSQFNEILLLLGLDRVDQVFFHFLVGDDLDTIKTVQQLQNGVEKFIKLSMLLFGNIDIAFSTLSKDGNEFTKWQNIMSQLDEKIYKDRHDPILPISKIPEEKTYYLGYIVHEEIKAKLKKNPSDPIALDEQNNRNKIVELGKRNQEAYLVSDHLDVYVATSMRKKHEYLAVSRFADEIFFKSSLKELKLRFFDPTQAYCEDRIDKGLSEGLMLKRARCTIYLAQESDTLGKDSELASTLAQGKPVIAFIPQGTSSFVEELLHNLKDLSPEISEQKILLNQLMIFSPNLAWEKPDILKYENDALLQLLKDTVKSYYDKRALTLSETHPLGLQVNLSTGVANGVLVVREVTECCDLLRRILTNSLEFQLERKTVDNKIYWLLREKITNCVYRAITSNISLTNSFWNYYLD